MNLNELTLNETRFSDPLDHIIQCLELGMLPTLFDVKNAKDELRKLRDKVQYAYEDAYLATNSSKEDVQRWISAEKERAKLSEENKLLKESLKTAVAWAIVNDRGDLYDLRLQQNPHVDQTIVLPLYSNKDEYKKLMSELKKPLDKADK